MTGSVPGSSGGRTLSIEEITEIAEAMEAEYGGDVAIRMVSSAGGKCRVEMLVTKAGCRQEPCLSMFSVNRDRTEFQTELKHAVAEAIRSRLE